MLPFFYIAHNFGGFLIVISSVSPLFYFVNDITNSSVCLEAYVMPQRGVLPGTHCVSLGVASRNMQE